MAAIEHEFAWLDEQERQYWRIQALPNILVFRMAEMDHNLGEILRQNIAQAERELAYAGVQGPELLLLRAMA
jgi:hypothetical protein